MTDTPKHSLSVAGVVVNADGQILVIKRRDNGHWEPPGGVLDLHEGFEDGVRREIFEETGVQVTVHYLSGIYKNMQRGIVNLTFRCSPLNLKASGRDNEAELVQWLPPEDATALMDPAYAIRLADAIAPSDAPVPARLHDGKHLL